ncbi:trypsin-like serine peptidase [Methylorubrum extorquens]
MFQLIALTLPRSPVAIAAVLTSITIGPALAQDASCAATLEAVDWRTVSPKAPPPEKTSDLVPDAGINPAASADTSKLPYSLAGKFVSSVNNEKRYCTAQFVDQDIILTAAHCVRDKNGTWLDQFEFSTPLAKGRTINEARCAATPSTWVTGNDGAFNWLADYALVVLNEKLSDQFLEIDPSPAKPDEIVAAIGFPKQISDGKHLQVVFGKLFNAAQLEEQASRGESTGLVVHGEPRYGLGISGGGWMALPRSADVASRHRILGMSASSQLVASYGPRLDQCAVRLLNFARKGCGLP